MVLRDVSADSELATKARSIHDDVDRLVERLEAEGAGKGGIRALRVYLKEVAAKLKEMLGEMEKAADGDLLETLPELEEGAVLDEELQALLAEMAGTAVAVTDEEPAAELVPIRKPWDESDNEISHRIRDPKDFQKDSFRRITLKKDKPRIFAIVGRLQGKTTTTIQALRFPKADGWTMASAKKWVAAHPDIGKQLNSREAIAKQLYVPILKADGKKQLVTGIALAVNRVDLQGDYVTKETVLDTMIVFMERYQQFGEMHEEQVDTVKVVECYQAPVDFVLKDTDYEVQEGDWVITAHVLDPDLWVKVESGEYAGFSIEGWAQRIAVDVDDLPADVEIPEGVAV